MGELNITGNKEFLKFLLPSDGLNDADMAALKYLVLKFPYCQPLQFTYAAVLKNTNVAEYENYLTRASLFAPRRDVLYRFVNDPASFHPNDPATVTGVEDGVPDLNAPEELPELSTAEPLVIIEETYGEPEEEPTPEEESHTDVETVISDAEAPRVYSDGETGPEDQEEDLPEPEIETIVPETEIPLEEPSLTEDDPGVTQPSVSSAKIEVESIASSDYFVFSRSAIDPLQGEKQIRTQEDPDQRHDVSKYDDDTMPYTFLWWLHKTRKEYAGTYQPYVQNPLYKQQRKISGELNQQIIENIFHLQPELNTFGATASSYTVEFQLKKKEDEIIEKFIQEEPQIKPPQANKIDTENKARKSSEDDLELVSETLARIYTDQMLYHKAIEIYRKLSLKFPDKKLYFAGQIEELEKKIS